MNDFITQFMQGQIDCSKGIPHQQGKGDNYDRGYSAQYAMEQSLTELDLRKEKDNESRRT